MCSTEVPTSDFLVIVNLCIFKRGIYFEKEMSIKSGFFSLSFQSYFPSQNIFYARKQIYRKIGDGGVILYIYQEYIIVK